KTKLKSEGLFDSDRKQWVPEDARRVGVITSASGAALHDILAVIERRSPMTQVFLYPVPVQGTEAAPALVAAVQQANALHESQAVPLDVLIVGRGGGSAEDLWAFNDEALAHAIADSTLPIVSAVGHEVDFSISDFVADQRAATPSAAAELVTLDTMEWMQRLDDIQRSLQNTVKRRCSHAQDQLGHLRARLRHPGVVLAQQQQLLSGQQQRLGSLIKNRIDQGKTTRTHLSGRLHARHPMQKLVDLRSRLADRQQRLQRRQRQILERLNTGLAQQQQLLRSLGPDNTLARGYALVTDAQGQIIRQASATEPGDGIRVRLAEGGLQAQVTGVTEPEAES
ncbi:MAG: exodeoxyribonuclease VII large subunit, partial [Luminiphilus sp.]